MLPALAQAADKANEPSLEFHGYIHLKLQTSPSLTDYTPTYDSYWNTMGREGATMGWIRLAPTLNLGNGSRLVVEVESSGNAFQNGSDDVFNFTQGTAYLEMPVANASKIWFGRRNLELNVQRWSDASPFGPNSSRLNGAGLETKWGDVELKSTLGLASDRTVSYRPTPAATSDTTINLKKLVFVQQATTAMGNNASLAPLLVVEYSGKNSQLEAARDTIKDTGATESDSEADQRANVQAAVGYTSWGDGWWNNLFAGVATQNARRGTASPSSKVGRSDKDLVTKIGTQGGYNGLRQSADMGLYYGARVDVLSYKNDMQKLKIENNSLVADGTEKSKLGYYAGLSMQPIYYVTEKVHGAFDVTYSHRAAVNDGTSGNPSLAGLPSALALSPIIRYATKAEPIAIPQLYASATYTMFNAKHPRLKDGKGEPMKSLTTVQAGMEVSF
jgi:hypothetical protein